MINNFKEFLEWYKQKEEGMYEKPSVTVDNVVFSYHQGKLKLLLIRRMFHPFKDYYCFPGGFVNYQEQIEDACLRELEEETHLKLTKSDIWQVHFFSRGYRDLRSWIMSMAFGTFAYPLPLIIAGDDAKEAFFIDIKIANNIIYLNSDILNVTIDITKSEDEFYEQLSYKYKEMLENIDKSKEYLAFDHDYMLVKAILSLKQKIQANEITFDYLSNDDIKNIYNSLEISI